ncbi:ribosome recycling factor [Coprinellus micaceus]|uniref:Ribosome recycling factor n=1 Tax=Coprinellus micaceus TaxID=71717 RepID=A0A4Y7T6S6_COPMI|nr:ribosome recycling factor [Coprinellus micaceus]
MSLPRALSQRFLTSLRSNGVARTQISPRIPAVAAQRSAVSAPSLARFYATKGKAKSTANIVPGSKLKIVDEDAKKETAVEWFRKECAGYETRASGRVTPAILSPVRVKIPGDTTEHPLEALATVGVREGTTLLITLFDEHNMKHVESALYTCNIPGVVPHKHDNQTVKVPIPKPTVEARHALYAAAKKKAEEIRTQVRKQHSASLRKGKFEKHSVEGGGEIDSILKALQKATGAK